MVMKIGLRSLSIGLTLAIGLCGIAQAQDTNRRVPTSAMEVKLSYAPLVKKVSPAVVNIYTRKVVKSRRSSFFDHPLFRDFFQDNRGFGMPQERVLGSLGSGVIVKPNGIIVTNNHVIKGADEITVVLADRREFPAEVVMADAGTDLAVLRIETGDEQLSYVSLANSDTVEVGDIVLAIGNPFGIGQTVTSGIVSAQARTQKGISEFGFFIQTDAAINPGNSGGALIGLDGQLMGVNTAIYSRTGTSNGIGFAIPANMVKSVLTAALDGGRLVRPWMGFGGQTVSSDIASSMGLDRPGGVIDDNLYPNGPAESAGLDVGDVIMGIDGYEVIDDGSLQFRIATKKAGESVKLVVLKEGRPEELRLMLDLPPEDPPRSITKLDGDHPFRGVTIANLSPRYNEEIHISTMKKGVMIIAVDGATPAAQYGYLRPGDVFVLVNGQRINTVANINSALEASSETYIFRVERKGRLLECGIKGRSIRCGEIR